MKKWICSVCGYIHEGAEPPEVCPICGAPRSAFEPYEEEEARPQPASRPAVPIVKPSNDNDPQKAVFSLSYGLYVISSQDGDRLNAQIANTVFQLTSEPLRLAICLNKSNFTNEMVSKSGIFAVTTLGKSGFGLVPGFGFRSGRDTDKFAGVEYEISPVINCPIPQPAVAYLECRVGEGMKMDVGTHTLFVADIVGGNVYENSEEPMTYADYRQLKSAAAGAGKS